MNASRKKASRFIYFSSVQPTVADPDEVVQYQLALPEVRSSVTLWY
jgi:hypothetical protein